MPVDLTGLLKLVESDQRLQLLVDGIRRGTSVSVSVANAAKPYMLAALMEYLDAPVLVVSGRSGDARRLFEQTSLWSLSGRARFFPEPESLPYERVVTDSSAEMERLQVLSAISGLGGSGSRPTVVFASASALVQKTLSPEDFAAATQEIRVGMEVLPFDLLARWQAMGYRLEPTVDVPGTISHRGGILDVYPPHSECPARIEFFGNTIDSIRSFDPASQRSMDPLQRMAITPATELLALSSNGRSRLERVLEHTSFDGLDGELRRQLQADLESNNSSRWQFYAPLFNRASILDYLPESALVIVDEPDTLFSALGEIEREAEEIRAERVRQRVLPGDFPLPYFTESEMRSLLASRRKLEFAAWGIDAERESLPFSPASSYAGQLFAFIQRVSEMIRQEKCVVVVSHQAERLSELFEEQGLTVPVCSEVKEVPVPGSLCLVRGLLGEGWVFDDRTYLFTDTEIFGFTKQRRVPRKRPVPRHKLAVEIKPGDYVVHVEHGIAKLAGITTFRPEAGRTGEKEKEYLVLEYAGGDKLYVPADQIDRVTKYIGTGDRAPTLTRLGTQDWNRTRQKVSEAVEKVAKELLALYAAREVVPGHAFGRDTVWQQELEASFPYVETPDQLTVQNEVKEDMEKPKPMDRLVCGDVGYGKTEIAVRAAFKAVMDHKQVAVLVPTTVLAQQHYITFSQRFSAFPIKVEVLSRFRTHKEQQAVLEGLADGTVDVCIGTHRLIQKDVVFKDLGLLIIDEEQRFGVAHKEFLKKVRHEVDVLALSATPIPRTLHMSLVGVRDMSVMETPPEDRLPVKTYVAAYEDRLVREAIVRELERNGQVFFVHNRVQSIASVAGKLQTLVPEARFAIGHGQMGEEELERVMTDFVQGEADVLVCTTIIESGLDMPNVNTLIVNHADRFGLTQLYQLRGRVGRGANTAYAYFLYDKGKHLTELAEKRLRTIFEATELGAGFGIAMKDLEIRGAGNLLGLKQSGHISAVGFNLYTQLLARAVDELKARRAGVPEEKVRMSHLPPPTIDLPLPAFIPEEYVEDLNSRIMLYQKLVKVNRMDAIEGLAREFTDRFGTPPPEVQNLLYAVKMKVLASRAAIESIAMDEGDIVLRRFEGMRFDRKKMEPLLTGLRLPAGAVRFDPLAIRLNPKRIGGSWPKLLEEVVRKAA